MSFFKRQEPSPSRSEGTADVDAKVDVKIDRLTGAMRVDPRQLLRSKATQDLLDKAESIELQIKDQSG